MADYIEREALIEWLKRIPLIDLSDGRGLCRVIMEDDFKKAIKKMPKGIIADIAPVRHGKWVDALVRDWRCSECGKQVPKQVHFDGYCYDDKLPYCPNCGKRMDGGDDGETD